MEPQLAPGHGVHLNSIMKPVISKFKFKESAVPINIKGRRNYRNGREQRAKFFNTKCGKSKSNCSCAQGKYHPTKSLIKTLQLFAPSWNKGK